MPPDRPRLWESVKRALGGAPSEPGTPRDEPPPFLSAEDAFAEPPPDPPPVHPLPEDLGLPSPPPEIAAGPETPARDVVPEPPTAPQAPEAAPGGPRLARGLASFSRQNADREKKFRHILSDGDAGKKK